MESKGISQVYPTFDIHSNSNGRMATKENINWQADVIKKAFLYHSNFRILLLFMLVGFFTINRIFYLPVAYEVPNLSVYLKKHETSLIFLL